MKKLLSLVFIVGIFALASCGGSEKKGNASADSTAAAAKADSMLKMSAGDTTTKVAADTTHH